MNELPLDSPGVLWLMKEKENTLILLSNYKEDSVLILNCIKSENLRASKTESPSLSKELCTTASKQTPFKIWKEKGI